MDSKDWPLRVLVAGTEAGPTCRRPAGLPRELHQGNWILRGARPLEHGA
ncbi:hypothetical protein [Streptomyces cyaneofuscatus]